MFRSNLLRFFLACGMLLALTAHAATINIALMMGGNDTATAADAARLLKADPALRNVKVKVYSMLDFPEQAETSAEAATRTLLARSQHIFVSTSVGRRFVELAGQEIKLATQAGGKAY
ncbi:MAG: hypothetical protein ABL855_07990, partial [Sideroxydans sp.]